MTARPPRPATSAVAYTGGHSKCPICGRSFASEKLILHADRCASRRYERASPRYVDDSDPFEAVPQSGVENFEKDQASKRRKIATRRDALEPRSSRSRRHMNSRACMATGMRLWSRKSAEPNSLVVTFGFSAFGSDDEGVSKASLPPHAPSRMSPPRGQSEHDDAPDHINRCDAVKLSRGPPNMGRHPLRPNPRSEVRITNHEDKEEKDKDDEMGTTIDTATLATIELTTKHTDQQNVSNSLKPIQNPFERMDIAKLQGHHQPITSRAVADVDPSLIPVIRAADERLKRLPESALVFTKPNGDPDSKRNDRWQALLAAEVVQLESFERSRKKRGGKKTPVHRPRIQSVGPFPRAIPKTVRTTATTSRKRTKLQVDLPSVIEWLATKASTKNAVQCGCEIESLPSTDTISGSTAPSLLRMLAEASYEIQCNFNDTMAEDSDTNAIAARKEIANLGDSATAERTQRRHIPDCRQLAQSDISGERVSHFRVPTNVDRNSDAVPIPVSGSTQPAPAPASISGESKSCWTAHTNEPLLSSVEAAVPCPDSMRLAPTLASTSGNDESCSTVPTDDDVRLSSTIASSSALRPPSPTGINRDDLQVRAAEPGLAKEAIQYLHRMKNVHKLSTPTIVTFAEFVNAYQNILITKSVLIDFTKRLLKGYPDLVKELSMFLTYNDRHMCPQPPSFLPPPAMPCEPQWTSPQHFAFDCPDLPMENMFPPPPSFFGPQGPFFPPFEPVPPSPSDLVPHESTQNGPLGATCSAFPFFEQHDPKKSAPTTQGRALPEPLKKPASSLATTTAVLWMTKCRHNLQHVAPESGEPLEHQRRCVEPSSALHEKLVEPISLSPERTHHQQPYVAASS